MSDRPRIERRVRPHAEPLPRLGFLAPAVGVLVAGAVGSCVYVGADWNLKQQVGGGLLAAVLGLAAAALTSRLVAGRARRVQREVDGDDQR